MPTMILAVCLLLLDTITAVQLPGVAWSKLQIWEASSLADVWSRIAEYLEFRTYALGCLGDLGFMDHLLNDFTPTLRVIGGVGAATGMVCALASASSRRSISSTSRSSDEEEADEAVYTLEDVRVRSYDPAMRLLRFRFLLLIVRAILLC